MLQSQARLQPQSMTDTSIESHQNNPKEILKVTNATLIWTAADINVDIFVT